MEYHRHPEGATPNFGTRAYSRKPVFSDGRQNLGNFVEVARLVVVGYDLHVGKLIQLMRRDIGRPSRLTDLLDSVVQQSALSTRWSAPTAFLGV